jgi:putative copper export protein
MNQGRLAALAETLAALAVAAWVGGMFALGAFSARIVFRDLPRDLAAPTMSAIFRSFDGVVVACVVLVALATGVRLIVLGVRSRADRIALVAGTALCVLGLIDIGYVHPTIEHMFLEGRTLEPAFQALHKLSSRSANLEAICAILMVGAHAFSRKLPA